VLRHIVLACAGLSILASAALAQSPRLEIVDGNIFLTESALRRQLTTGGSDSGAVLSPDGRWVAFVRTDKTHPVDLNKEPAVSSLYVMASTSKAPRLLISRGTPCGRNRFLADFESLDFLSDGVRLAFQSSWAAVHGSTQIVDVTTGTCRHIAAGNRLYVVKRGKYRDHLLVSLHKYFVTSGTYDWWWLLTPNGIEIGPVAEDTDGGSDDLLEFREMYEDDP
jgi:hypothetical protein